MSNDMRNASPADYKGVWVFGEQIDGAVQEVALELIGKGRELADKREVPLTVVMLGNGMDAAARDLLSYPVDKVIQVEASELEHYAAEPYARVLADLVQKEKPEIILAGATAIGRSFLARVAVMLRTGLTADCTGLDIGDDGLLHQTLPAFGGNIMATIVCKERRPQMATVRPKVMQPAEKDGGRNGVVEKIIPEPALVASRTRRLEWLPEVMDTVNLAGADTIIAVGRGLGKAEGMEMVAKLAKRMDAAIGATRAAVDAGWVPYSCQIGQTGKTVKPKLYIALGISGAVQHTVGFSSCDRIIAVNRDKDAPIFSVADYGVVGDIYEIVPAMIRELGG